MRRMWLTWLRPYWKKIALAFGAIFVANLCGLALPWAVKVLIDDVLVAKNYGIFNFLIGGLIVVALFQVIFGFLRIWWISCVAERVTLDMRKKLYSHLQRLSVSYLESRSTGDIISRITGDVENVRQFILSGAIDFLYAFFNILFCLVLLLYLDWRLTLIGVVYLPVFSLVFIKFIPRLKKDYKALRGINAQWLTRVQEVISGIRVVAGFGTSKYENERSSNMIDKILRKELRVQGLRTGLWVFADFVTSLGLITLLAFGAGAVWNGRLTPGGLVAFYSYLGMLFMPVVKIAAINSSYQEAAASMERIEEVLEAKPLVSASDERRTPNTEIKGDVEFRGVCFAYPGAEKEVLQDINLHIRVGEKVAFVGPSGAGKTTLVSLLNRFYDPTEGDIFIDGENLRDISLDFYRSKIGLVLQDDFLFDMSVEENISYGVLNDRDRIIEAAKIANIHSFIESLPEGYRTRIREQGKRFSKGQRQAIAIARAIVRDPAIFILDEATAYIDFESEFSIHKSLRKAAAGRTVFIVAHSLPMIYDVDKIVVVEHGRITAVGSHSELILRQGFYRGLYERHLPSEDMAETSLDSSYIG